MSTEKAMYRPDPIGYCYDCSDEVEYGHVCAYGLCPDCGGENVATY